MGGNLAGTLMLAIAAFAPSRKLRVQPRTVLLSAGALGLVVALARRAPRRRRARDARAERQLADLQPEIGRVIVQLVTAAALVAAAVGLARREEPLLRWVAVAVVLAGVAKLDYALFPPLGPDNVHLGDLLRVAAWGVLLRSPSSARCAAASASAHRPRSTGERRRLARELHDGVAQELAFIRRRAGRLAELPDGVEIVDAAERALEDSRRAIEALVPPAHEPLDVALERLGARLATECGVEVQVNVRVATDCATRSARSSSGSSPRRSATPPTTAARATCASTSQGSPLAVRIIDDGYGFRDGANSGLGVAGYGLIAMRERAEHGRRPVQPRIRPRRGYSRAGGAAIDQVRVLVADDHAPTREDIATALGQDGGFEIIATAEDAPGAVDAALREQPDLALLDVNMPGSGPGRRVGDHRAAAGHARGHADDLARRQPRLRGPARGRRGLPAQGHRDRAAAAAPCAT